MPKRAISVTLDDANLTWLKARAGTGQARSVSDLLDQLVTHARTRGKDGTVKSVVGTIDVDASDPLLLRADDAVDALFASVLGRPAVVREARATHGNDARRTRPRSTRTRRG